MVFVCERLRQGWKTTHTARVGAAQAVLSCLGKTFLSYGLRMGRDGGRAAAGKSHPALFIRGREMNISGIYILSVLLRILRAGLTNERSIIEIF